MHEDNIFLTLTYDQKHLKSPRLDYSHWQKFARALRKKNADRKLPIMVTGEYGDLQKRPHWHALIFNYSPHDRKLLRENELGDHIFSSAELTSLWGKGLTEFGSVTLDSASYVARYAAKKLIHGDDQSHDYHPIHYTSSRNAIGKSWIQNYYKTTFANGYVTLPNGSRAKIPRYYVDWLKENHPKEWNHYVTEVREKIIEKSQAQASREELDYLTHLMSLDSLRAFRPLTRAKVKETILQSKFKTLQEKLKL